MRDKSIEAKGVAGAKRDSSADATPISTIHNSTYLHGNHNIRPVGRDGREVAAHDVPLTPHSHDNGLMTDETYGNPNQKTVPHSCTSVPDNTQPAGTGPSPYHSSPSIVVQPGNFQMTSTITKVPDYTALSICVLLCFCLPFGLVAYMKASDARVAMVQGDLDLALAQARESRNWSIAGIVCHVLITGIVITVILSYVYIK